MKEITFIRSNFKNWQHVENMVDDEDFVTPDELATAYIDTTSDLAFSQTHYPRSRITLYLNSLASALHHRIYRNKKEERRRIITYWTHEVPLVMWDARRLLLLSFVVFVGSWLLGVCSQLADADFCRYILGDGYVDMTLDNIAKGKPMDVYANESELPMFLSIAINNIWVSFRIFIMGMFTAVASGLILVYNGVMVGCFQTFFAQQGHLGEALLTIHMHGVLELTAVVVAGAAGFSLGNGWLFPGTYTRIEAFRRGAQRGMKIVVGTVPVFILAAFIEGFVTRHVAVGDVWRGIFIGLNLLFVIYYYIILPYKRSRNESKNA